MKIRPNQVFADLCENSFLNRHHKTVNLDHELLFLTDENKNNAESSILNHMNTYSFTSEQHEHSVFYVIHDSSSSIA